MCAMMLSAAAVLAAYKYKYGFLGGAILLGVSMGIYQAYVAYSMTLCVILLRNKQTLRNTVFLGLRYALTGILGFVVYFVGLYYRLRIENEVLRSYQGIDSMGGISLSSLMRQFPLALESFYNFYFGDFLLYSSDYNHYALYAGMFLTLICGIVFLCVRNKLYVQKASILLLCGLLLLLPFGVCLPIIMALSASYHILMFMQFSLVTIFAIVCIELVSESSVNNSPYESKNFPKKICYFIIPHAWITTIICFLLIFNWYLLSNVAYLNMHVRYEKTYSLATRILDRVEQQPDFTSTRLLLS